MSCLLLQLFVSVFKIKYHRWILIIFFVVLKRTRFYPDFIHLDKNLTIFGVTVVVIVSCVHLLLPHRTVAVSLKGKTTQQH